MRKKYFSPMFAELNLEFEDVLWDSANDNKYDDQDTDDFDPPDSEDFDFNLDNLTF